MKKHLMYTLIVLIFFLESFFGLASARADITTGRLFWADSYYQTIGSNTISHANLDGSGAQELVGNLEFPRYLSANPTEGKLYWSSQVFSNQGKIQRSSFDGSNVEDIIVSTGITPYGIDIDPLNSKIYWASYDGYKIQSSDLDGSNIEDIIFTSSPHHPWALALDTVNSKVFYSTSDGTEARIMRVDIDGSSPEEFLIGGSGSIRGLELDLINDKMYWAEVGSSTDKIGRANLDGTGVEYIVEGLTFLDDIALDLQAGLIYWTIPPHGSDLPLIQCANLDGSGVETIITDGLVVPRGIEVVPVPEPVIPINLDIKPWSCPNPVNVKSKGILPVAILGTEEFEVSTIDPASIFLNGVPVIRSSYEDVSAPLADPNECECTTDGPDGFGDLTLKFVTQDVLEALGEVNTGDVLTLPLTGVLNDETSIEGADCIVIVGRFKPINKADINKDGVVNTIDMAIVAENWLRSSIVEE